MRYLAASVWAVVILLAVAVTAFAATTYSGTISVTNTSATAYTGYIASLSPLSGDGLETLTSDMRKVSITRSGAEALWEGRTDSTAWRLVIPSVSASSGQTYAMTIDDTTQVDALGCACWSYAAHDAGTQAPGADSLDLSATVVVKADTFSESSSVGTSKADQYTSNRRLTYLAGFWYMVTAEGQNVKVYLSSNGTTWTSQHTETFTAPDVPQSVAVTSANGYIHVAMYVKDDTNDQNSWHYIRGTQNTSTGALTMGSLVNILTRAQGAADAITDNGVAITLTGTRQPVLMGVYPYWDGAEWDVVAEYMGSADTDNYNVATDTVVSGTITNGVGLQATALVDIAAFTGTDIAFVEKETNGVLRVYRINSAGAFVAGPTTIDAATGAAQFSVSSSGASATTAYVAYSYSGGDVESASYTNGGVVANGTILAAASGQYYPSITYSAQYLTAEDEDALIAYYLTPGGTLARKYALVSAPNTWTAIPNVTTAHSVGYISTPANIALTSNSVPDLDAEAVAFALVASPYTVTGGKVPARGHAILWKPGAYGLMVDQNLTAYAWTYTGGTDAATFVTTAGQHVFRLTYDGADLKIYEDGTLKTVTAAAGAVTAATTVLTIGYGFPVTKDASLSINAVETLRWFPALAVDATAPGGYSGADIVSATTGYVQEFNATSTDLTITLTSLQPATQAQSSATGTEPTPSIPLTPPATPGGLYDESGNMTFPGGGALQDAASAGSVPLGFVAGALGIIFVVFASLGATKLIPSPLITATITLLAGWLVVLMTPMPNWIGLLFIPYVYFIWRLQRQNQF